ncbi:MAG: hypothetical protein M0Q24_01540 [Sulfurimonas sp.]|uniref:hypothetical protein n=1 Tax=Sulfurimonas sp. TaxID=2022749 RepID=UPI0025D697B2|nr:hypothetical protein [Sulfurimonas sp.]MCK9490746.1 hypothetical protein [Sulfurimonas sp.]
MTKYQSEKEQRTVSKNYIYKSSSNIAEYDHLSYRIELHKYGSHFKNDIEETLKLNSTSEISKKEFDAMMNIHSILWHEYTHFLDHSTTLWGLEYNIRTLNLYSAIREKNDEEYIDDRYEVFCLNLAEERLHKLITKHKSSTNEYTVGYRLNYDKELGVYAQYSLYDKTTAIKDTIFNIDMADPVCEVPLSMLAVIEANAYAQEILFKFNTIKRYKINEKEEIKKLREELNNDINNCEMSEYTIMIRHALQVFPCLDFIKVLEIVSAVSRLVLNMPIFLFGTVNHHYIKSVFKSEAEYVKYLIHDHARGSSRASFYLMFIQWLSGEHAESTEFNIEDELDKIITGVTNGRMTLNSVDSMYKLELETALKFILEKEYSNPLGKISNINIEQAHLYKNFEFNFSKLLLPEFMLKDGEIVQMPQSLNLNLEEYADEIWDEYSKVDDLIQSGFRKRKNIAELGGDMYRDHLLSIEESKRKHNLSKLTRTQRRKADRKALKQQKKLLKNNI